MVPHLVLEGVGDKLSLPIIVQGLHFLRSFTSHCLLVGIQADVSEALLENGLTLAQEFELVVTSMTLAKIDRKNGFASSWRVPVVIVEVRYNRE